MEIKRVRNYMAILRNLRNLMKVGVSDRHMEMVCKAIANPNAVKHSKQFPFRFYSASKAVAGYDGDPFIKTKIQTNLDLALERSVANLPKFKGRTYITCDESGSMTMPVSGRSEVSCYDIANIMGALAYHISDEAIVGLFASQFGLANISPRDGVLNNMRKLREQGSRLGGSTNAYLALQHIVEKKIPVDRFLLFSDMQCYDTRGRLWRGGQSLAEEFRKYKSSVNPNVRLYSIDLAGYGTLQFPQDDPNVILMAGWSDRILNFIHKYESFSQTQIQEIEGYNPFISEEG